jgi:hypothetical protein
MNAATITEMNPAQPLVEAKTAAIAREVLSFVKMTAVIAVPLLIISLAWV